MPGIAHSRARSQIAGVAIRSLTLQRRRISDEIRRCIPHSASRSGVDFLRREDVPRRIVLVLALRITRADLQLHGPARHVDTQLPEVAITVVPIDAAVLQIIIRDNSMALSTVTFRTMVSGTHTLLSQ